VDPLYGFFDNVEVGLVISENTADSSGFRVNRYLIRSNSARTLSYNVHDYKNKDKSESLHRPIDLEQGDQVAFGQDSSQIFNFKPASEDEKQIEIVAGISDCAGNVREVTASITVDTQPPTGDFQGKLITDTDSALDGIDPLEGYYDSLAVSVLLSSNVVDNIGMRTNRYFIKTGDAGFLTSYNAYPYDGNHYFSEGADVPGIGKFGSATGSITGITYNAQGVYEVHVAVADGAGNLLEKTVRVTIDLTQPSSVPIVRLAPYRAGGNRVEADEGWYGSNEVDFYAEFRNGATDELSGLRDVPYVARVVTPGTNQISWLLEQRDPAFKQIWVPEDRSITKNSSLFVGLVDRAGNVASASVPVHVDLTPPTGNLSLIIRPDSKNDASQLIPESGYYNDNTMDLQWQMVSDYLGLKSRPFRVKANEMPWSDSLNVTSLEDFKVNNEGTVTIQILVADHAGNILIETASIIVDTQVPTGMVVSVLSDNTDSGQDGLLPEAGWYDDPLISLSWTAATDNGSGLRDKPYQTKSEVSNYDLQQSTTTATVEAKVKYTSYEDRVSSKLSVRAVDRAGNILEVMASINVDQRVPEPYTFTVKPDSQENPTYNPSAGWYNDHTLELEWSESLDFGGMRTSGSVLARVASDIPWVTLNENVSQTNNDTFWVSEDVSARTLVTRMVDHAGNVRTQASNGFNVDLTPPTFSQLALVGDVDVHGVALAAGWYDDQMVRWKWFGADNGGLFDAPYRYHNLVSPNSLWSDWNGQTGVEILTTWGIPQFFEVELRDQAGNHITRIEKVNVAGFAPSGNVNYFLSINVTEVTPGWTITPNVGWYASHTLNVVITTNYLNLLEQQKLTEDLTYYVYNTNGQTQPIYQGIPTFSKVICGESGRAGLTVVYGILLKSGLRIEGRQIIFVDTQPPQDFSATLRTCTDHGGDGVSPESGWVDTMNFHIDLLAPKDGGILRAQPYRYRFAVPTGSWSDYQSSEKIENLQISENRAYIVEVSAVDCAGNIATVSVCVTVDTMPPTFNGLEIILIPATSNQGIEPVPGWYRNDSLSGSVTWNRVTADDLRQNFLYVRTNSAKTVGNFSALTFDAKVVPADILPINIDVFIADHAGNVARSAKVIYSKVTVPGNSYVILKRDGNHNPWFKPEEGYYGRLSVDVEWAEPIGGGLRGRPYQIQSSLSSSRNWTASQDGKAYNGYAVSEGVQEIIVRAVDKAANIATFSTLVSVDVTAPEPIVLSLVQDLDNDSDGAVPLQGFDDDGVITVTFNPVFDNVALRDKPYCSLLGDLEDIPSGTVLSLSREGYATLTTSVEGIQTVSVV
ncbi:MAG: hypothetical protein AABZ14_00340, partial [Candidatus Margulisiibacteriota bacterium]